MEPMPDGRTLQRDLFSTNSQPLYAKTCAVVEAFQPNTPKPEAGYVHARKLALRSIADPVVAYQARANGLIKEIPKLRDEWPSVTAAAEAIGIKPTALSQALYRARKENGGSDAPTTVHGLCFAYVDTPAAI